MEIEQLVPQLRTTDLDRAIHFYTKKLGFALAFRYRDFYAGVSSGTRMIHLKLVDELDRVSTSSGAGSTCTFTSKCKTSMPLSNRSRTPT